MANLFLRPADDYIRNINPIAEYVEQNGFYLSKMTGKDIDVCKEFIVQGFKDRQDLFIDIKNPRVDYFERQDNKDKHKQHISLSSYINTVVGNNEVLAPTFTSYVPVEEEASLIVEFLDNNVAKRSIAKKESFKAEVNGQVDLFIAKEGEQKNMKLYNNACSGTFATMGSILHNPTAHNTLTSIVRSESSLSNASNEKIISGNRHYYNADVTLANLISITASIDKKSLKTMIDKYGLVYPTEKDVIDCIKYSSDLYWLDKKAFEKITAYISKLDEVERAGFMYIGDLFHVRKLNPGFIRDFLTELASKVTIDTNETHEELCLILHKADEQVINLVHHICMSEVRGKGKDYEKMPFDDVKKLVGTLRNAEAVVLKYRDFIENIFLTFNVPSGTSYIPNMIRRAVVLSDTDSTMFSVDEFVEWYFGEIVFNDKAWGIATAVTYLATQSISHILAILSANLGVTKSKLFDIAMKPEFTFPVFAQTLVAKHYYTCILVKEGNVFDDIKLEVKGVNLKNSAAPKVIVKEAHDKMLTTLSNIMQGHKISLKEEIEYLAGLELMIKESLLSGDVTFYKQSKVKNIEAYTRDANQSPYVNHTLWRTVLEPKYGAIQEPPYSVIKIPTTVRNITGMSKWLGEMEDGEMNARFFSWFKGRNKKDWPTAYMPVTYVQAFGIPKEIKQIINIKKIILDLTYIHRMRLDSLGYSIKPNWLVNEYLGRPI